MGKRSLRKGKRFEYQVRNEFRKARFDCVRVPCSGNSEAFRGDLLLRTGNRNLRVEVKARKNGLKTLYEWKGENDILVVKEDRKEPLAIISLSFLLELLGKSCNHGKNMV